MTEGREVFPIVNGGFFRPVTEEVAQFRREILPLIQALKFIPVDFLHGGKSHRSLRDRLKDGVLENPATPSEQGGKEEPRVTWGQMNPKRAHIFLIFRERFFFQLSDNGGAKLKTFRKGFLMAYLIGILDAGRGLVLGEIPRKSEGVGSASGKP